VDAACLFSDRVSVRDRSAQTLSGDGGVRRMR
jgi:hypothetical protein